MTTANTMRQERLERLREIADVLRSALRDVGTTDDESDDPELVQARHRLIDLGRKVDAAKAKLENEVSKPAMPTPRNTPSLLASLISVFKAVPDSELEDLRDALEDGTRPGADNWNSDLDHRDPTRRESPTGRPLSASGNGAPEAIREYSEGGPATGTTGRGDGNIRSYEDLARELTETREAVKAILNVFAALLKAGSGDDEDQEEERRAAAEGKDAADLGKAIPMLKHTDVLNALAGKLSGLAMGSFELANNTPAGVVPAPGRPNNGWGSEPMRRPPEFIGKSAPYVDVADELLKGGTLTTEQACEVATLKSRMAAYTSGQISLEAVYRGLRSLPPELQPIREPSRIRLG